MKLVINFHSFLSESYLKFSNIIHFTLIFCNRLFSLDIVVGRIKTLKL